MYAIGEFVEEGRPIVETHASIVGIYNVVLANALWVVSIFASGRRIIVSWKSSSNSCTWKKNFELLGRG